MWLKIFLATIVIIFISILIIKRFAYFRPSHKFIPPVLKYEDVYEGKLHGWFIQGQNEYVILFCHGNGGNISHRQEKLIELNKTGCSILIFDYSGYGQSKGVPHESLCYDNGCKFMELLLRKGYKKENIIPYGESLGAAVATYVARNYKLNKLIIESGLPSIKSVIKSWGAFFKAISFIFYEFNTVSYLSTYKGRSLVLHSFEDEIIPIQVVSELKTFSTEFVEMKGTHNNPEIPWDRINRFIHS